MPRFYLDAAIVLSILIPAASLSIRGASAAIFYILALLSLTALAHHKLKRFDLPDTQFPVAIACALGAPLLSTLLTAISTQQLDGSDLEKSFRFILALPVLWLLLQLPTQRLRQLQWGFIAAAYCGSLVILHAVTSGAGRDFASFAANYNAVTLANLVLLVGLGTLFTLPWTLSSTPKAEYALKLGAAGISIVATLASETRSSWMLLPVLLLIILVSSTHLKLRTRLLLFAGSVLALAVLAACLYAFNPRFLEIIPNIHSYFSGGNRDTSVGVRLQLWEAAITMFKQNPWLGIGAGNFHGALVGLAEQGAITPFVAENFGESHNDFIQALVSKGLVGLIAMCALYWVPAIWFARQAKSLTCDAKIVAQLGLLLCLGYTVFSLTELMFRNMRSVPFYSILLVMLASLACAARRPSCDRADRLP